MNRIFSARGKTSDDGSSFSWSEDAEFIILASIIIFLSGVIFFPKVLILTIAIVIYWIFKDGNRYHYLNLSFIALSVYVLIALLWIGFNNIVMAWWILILSVLATSLILLLCVDIYIASRHTDQAESGDKREPILGTKEKYGRIHGAVGLIGACSRSKSFKWLLVSIPCMILLLAAWCFEDLKDCNDEMCALILLYAIAAELIIFVPVIMSSMAIASRGFKKSIFSVLSFLAITILCILLWGIVAICVVRPFYISD
jgi:hypothetical protein